MRELREELLLSGEIASEAREFAVRLLRKKLTLLEIAERVEEQIISLGGLPAFPCNICVNEVAAHFTPNRGEVQRVRSGDLVKIDVGAHVDGFIADTATTVRVGGGDEEIIRIAEEAIESAVEIIKRGVKTNEIGERIERAVTSAGYRVMRGLNGHNIERFRIHGGLTIPNESAKRGFRLHAGDVITIEPFVTRGSGESLRRSGRIYRVLRSDVKRVRSEDAKNLLRDLSHRFGSLPFSLRWLEDSKGMEELLQRLCVYEYPVVFSIDGEEVSQVEHTILVGENSCEIITL